MIRKTRLLAGFMTAVLLSTTCLGGVRAAGEDGITTLNASASEDESATWKATVTAGETLFPEGTELLFAVADEEARAAVQEQLLTENAREEGNAEEDTTAGKTLQDLHVYDFGLTDAEKAEIDYTDKVTYSVKSNTAADTDTDAADYVIYRVVENEDSGEGAAVTLEPIEDSTGTVKLDESGWMTEFSVETEPVERIAVAVYKTAAAEMDESSEEGDGTEEEENAGNVGVSTFAVNVGGTVTPTEVVDTTDFAPVNRLQIRDNMDNASVEVLESSGVQKDDDGNDRIYKLGPESEKTEDGGDGASRGLSQGDFWGYIPEEGGYTNNSGIGFSMYPEMRGGTDDKKYGGISIMFEGSSLDYVTGEDKSSYRDQTDEESLTEYTYQWSYEAGWKEADRNLTGTTMKVKLLYRRVGYYNGRVINAVADIKITPSKNRNPACPYYDNTNYHAGYHGTYYPMIQVSASLYRGWVWQNVKEFNVKLSFYYEDDGVDYSNSDADNYYQKVGAISIGGDSAENMHYSSMYADYYTINSLNPQRDNEDWERPPRYIGPEYVLPNNNVLHAYVTGKFTVDGNKYTSNIATAYGQYDGDTQYYQHAYFGGPNTDGSGDTWGGAGVDEQGTARFKQNSVMIVPKTTDVLSFTMGNLERRPWENENRKPGDADYSSLGYTMGTDIMWAAISTEPFSGTRTQVVIPVNKQWKHINYTKEQITAVEVELWAVFNTSDSTDESTLQEHRIRTIELTADNEWRGKFRGVDSPAEFLPKDGYYNFRYEVREVSVTINGEKISSSSQEFPYELSDDSVTILNTQSSSDAIKNGFTLVNTKEQTGSITINKVDAANDNAAMNGVVFTLDKIISTTDQTIDTTFAQRTETTANGRVLFSDLPLGVYRLTETKTLPGYTLLKEPVIIEIPLVVDSSTSSGSVPAGDGGVQETDGKTYYYNLTYTITNGQSFDLPQTGGTSADRIMRTGMVLFATAAGALLYLNRKRRREQQKS